MRVRSEISGAERPPYMRGVFNDTFDALYYILYYHDFQERRLRNLAPGAKRNPAKVLDAIRPDNLDAATLIASKALAEGFLRPESSIRHAENDNGT